MRMERADYVTDVRVREACVKQGCAKSAATALHAGLITAMPHLRTQQRALRAEAAVVVEEVEA